MFEVPLEKVTVTQEVFQALKHFQVTWGRKAFFDTGFLERAKDNPTVKSVCDYRHSVGDFLFSQTIFIGYEVELSLEEQLKERYIAWTNEGCGNAFYDAVEVIAEKIPELRGVLD